MRAETAQMIFFWLRDWSLSSSIPVVDPLSAFGVLNAEALFSASLRWRRRRPQQALISNCLVAGRDLNDRQVNSARKATNTTVMATGYYNRQLGDLAK